MKKIKLLMPVLGVTTLASTIVPITSCGNKSTIRIDADTYTLAPGEYVRLNAVTNSNKEVKWSSSDENVATVVDGWVIAVNKGICVITAESNGVKATCDIIVSEETIVPSYSDWKFLTKINDYMSYGETFVAPHKAITALKDLGWDVLSYKLSNAKLEFAFDAAVKKFIIMNGDEVVASPTGYKMASTQLVFKFTSSYDATSKYGQYLLDNYEWDTPAEQFNVYGSIDVGNNTNIKNMHYVPTNASRTVYLRTYCEYLNMDANNDTIVHMGVSNNIEVYGNSKESKCNYTEIGRTGYLYAENANLSIVKITSADNAEIDVLEASTGVSAVAGFFNEDLIGTFVGSNTITGWEKTPIAPTPVANWTGLNDALTKTDDVFIRLAPTDGTNKISIPSGIKSTISIKNRTFILDLAGCNLVDESGIDKQSALFEIVTSDDSLTNSTVTFIDSYRQGSIQLNNHKILVKGNKTSKTTASLYLEGANVNFTADTGRYGAIEVGETGNDATDQQYSRLYMFGGVLTATSDVTPSHTGVEADGIYVGENSYVQIVYGSIYAKANCIRSNGSRPNAFADLVNATLKTTNTEESYNSECIYWPAGTLNISGGLYEGDCCIAMRGGNVNISGGYLHSTGKSINYTKESKSSGMLSDGSTICVELCNGATGVTYGTNPTLTVSNATLQSDTSYVMNVYRNDSTTNVNQFFEADFFGGMYYYYVKAEGTTSVTDYDGIRIAYADDLGLTSDNYRIYQQSGSWIYTGK